MNRSSLRIGLRLARRELRSRPARAALVLLLIVVPTAAMTVVTTLFRTGELSRESIRATNYGAATYRGYFIGQEVSESGRFAPSYAFPSGPTDVDIDSLRASVPAGTPFLVERGAQDRVRRSDYARTFTVTDVDLTDPLVSGRYTLVAGRAPRTASEAVVNRQLAAALHLRIGSIFEPERLARPMRVVGTMTTADNYSDFVVTKAPLPPRPTSAVFIGASATKPAAPGWSVDSTVYTKGSGQLSNADKVLWTYVGGTVGLFVIGTIVAAAFALGARRQLRSIGLLAASGGSPRVIAWALTAQGAVAGLLGSLIGVAVGIVGVQLLPLRLLQSFTTRQVHGPIIRPTDFLPIVLIGTGAAMGAAAFPARSAAGLPTLQALGSRRPVMQVRRGSWVIAAATLGLGSGLLAWSVAANDVQNSTAAMLIAVIASVLPFVAALVAAPLVVARLEQLSTRAPLAWRLAGRSLARNRSRSASVVGATCAVVGLVIAVSTLLHSWSVSGRGTLGDALLEGDYLRPNQVLVTSEYRTAPHENGSHPDLSDVVNEPPPPAMPVEAADLARIRAVVPSARQIDLTTFRDAAGGAPFFQLDAGAPDPFVHTQYGSAPIITVATPDLLELFNIGPALRARLAAGDAVVVRPPGAPDLRPAAPEPNAGAVLHAGGSVVSSEAALALPRVLIDAEKAARLGWTSVPAGVTVFVAPHRFTPREATRLQLVDADLSWEREVAEPAPPNTAYYETYISVGHAPYRFASPTVVRFLGFVATALFVLAVVGIGLGLSARDNQDEHAVLDAVGAPPRVRRQVGTRRAVLLVVVACVIAIPSGLIPVAALIAASDHNDSHFGVDWIAMLAVTVGLPLVIAAAAAGGGWVRDRVRPRRPEVFAFAE
ncbi:MAG: putative transport system permease protein [Actinomycetota bacterium]|jgi:putative ABC transport system permease protein